MIRRTFHIETLSQEILNVQEFGQQVALAIGNQEVFMTEDQFKELCDLRYSLNWFTPESQVLQAPPAEIHISLPE